MNCRNRGDGDTDINKFDTHVMPPRCGNLYEVSIVIQDGNTDNSF
jgi:hypothetical protein